MNFLLCSKLILLLSVLCGSLSLPARDLTDEDWDALLDLIGKSKNQPSYNNEYYETLTLKPIIFKMDFDNDFIKKDTIDFVTPKITKKVATVSVEKVPEEKSFWSSVKTFFTDDLNSLAKEIAENYNPVPPIESVIDDVKRSDTWIDVRSFFTKSYNQFIKFSESVIDDIKASINEE